MAGSAKQEASQGAKMYSSPQALAAVPRRAWASLLRPIPHALLRGVVDRSRTSDELRATDDLFEETRFLRRQLHVLWALRDLREAGYLAGRSRETRTGRRLASCPRDRVTLLVERRAGGHDGIQPALDGMLRVLQFQGVLDDLDRDWPEGVEELDDAEEQALFERWKRKSLRHSAWSCLPAEDCTLLVHPLLALVYWHGYYRAMMRSAREQPMWRFASGQHCRRHDAMDGMVARHDDPVWRTSLPPLSYHCDCTVSALRKRDRHRVIRSVPEALPPPCRFFGHDKRSAPRHFLSAYLAAMKEACLPECLEDAGATRRHPWRPAAT